MDNEKQNQSIPAANPNSNQGESQQVNNNEWMEERERLWKHESEIPDATKDPKQGAAGSGERREGN